MRRCRLCGCIAQGSRLLGEGGEKERVRLLTVQRCWCLQIGWWLLLCLCWLQWRWPGSREAGMEYCLPHEQDRGGCAAAGRV